MEKFGIFELLDALSALTAQENAPAEKATPSPEDAAYRPPAYGAAEPAAPAAPQSADGAGSERTPSPDRAALSEFYARHEEIAKKTRKK